MSLDDSFLLMQSRIVPLFLATAKNDTAFVDQCFDPEISITLKWGAEGFIRADGFNTQELAMQGSFRAFLGY